MNTNFVLLVKTEAVVAFRKVLDVQLAPNTAVIAVGLSDALTGFRHCM